MALLLASLAVAGMAVFVLVVGTPPRRPDGNAGRAALSIVRSSPPGVANVRVGVRPRLPDSDPGSLHDWLVEITDGDGAPVSGCRVSLDATMPEHGHGLPTEPRLEREEPKGTYVVRGVRFSMPGHWLLSTKVSGCGPPQKVDFAVRF